MRKVWVSIPGMVKSAQCRQRLATAATFLCYPNAQRWAPVTFTGVGSQHSPSPVTIAEKIKPFFFFFLNEPTFHHAELAEIAIMFSSQTTPSPTKHFSVTIPLQAQWSPLLTSAWKVAPSPHKCFYNSSTDCDAMLQYRYPVVQLFCCVLLEVHFCHWCCCETIKK